MKNLRRALPPLDALLFFEAAARRGGFTAAAGELNVTQAAVSKRVKALEERLGAPLFHRRGRAVTLTAEGRLLHARTAEALDYLSAACAAVADAGTASVTVAANVAVSHYWLGPRITEYQLGADAAPVRLVSSDRTEDQLDASVSMAVHYGLAPPPGWDGTPLFAEVLVPLVAPGRVSDARRGPLLDYERQGPDWVNWGVWLAQSPGTEFEATPVLGLGSYVRAIDAAVQGKGVALGSPGLLAGEIASGRLVPLPGTAFATGRGYHLVTPAGRGISAAAEALRLMLLADRE
ncbi:LysR family transcriptional regulator [Limibaculum sp. M0105]|uniref:LysR family transcriptional regulator n=1 Tax=Thermohalobaculum xanthum TaxID=2753746 RepID=A0A8J7SGL5_9RHOB|nr:LysR family transcriptional regulator [Thermohalobaculum xanthum]MBK0401011.1 LysR family transcriptional regulator [Thermohalobaculum xanthum]